MKKLIIVLVLLPLFALFNISCIDRDTIAGTGKLEPELMLSGGGGFQSGAVNTQLPLPIIVRVFDAKNKPVRGVRVEFFAPNGNATFSDTIVVTDGDGYAKTTVKLGQKEDSVHVQAIVPGIKGSPVIFSLFAFNAGAQNILIKSGNNQTGTVATTLSEPLTVEVKDVYNNPVKSTVVYFLPSGKGKVNPGQMLTDSLGIAKSYWTTDTTVGNQTVEARITATQTSFVTFKALVKASTVVGSYEILSKDSAVGLQGGILLNAIVVKVKDKYGNLIGGLPIRFKITNGGGKVPANALLSDENGIIRCTFDLDGFGSVTTIQGYDNSNNVIPQLVFTMYTYEYVSIDSLSSSGGAVFLSWIKNPNPFFLNYKIERCSNINFDNSTVVVATLTNENTTTVNDNSSIVGTSPFYRVQTNYTNGYSFYSYNIKQITVQP